jgi:hypothetical protein
MLPMIRGHKKKLWKVLEVSAGLMALVLWMVWYGLWMRYAQTRPSLADPERGRTYLLYTHGHVAYLNRMENLQVHSLEYLASAFLVSAVLMDLLKKPFRN